MPGWDILNQYLDMRVLLAIIFGSYFLTEKTSILNWKPFQSKNGKAFAVLAFSGIVMGIFIWLDSYFKVITSDTVAKKLVSYTAATSFYELLIKPLKDHISQINMFQVMKTIIGNPNSPAVTPENMPPEAPQSPPEASNPVPPSTGPGNIVPLIFAFLMAGLISMGFVSTPQKDSQTMFCQSGNRIGQLSEKIECGISYKF